MFPNISALLQKCPLTYELHRSVQPGQDLLTEGVVHRDSQEVRLGDEVGLGAGVTGVQDVADVVLLHQILETETQTRFKPVH